PAPPLPTCPPLLRTPLHITASASLCSSSRSLPPVFRSLGAPPVNGHRFLPSGGHRFSPLADTFSPRWWPSDLPSALSSRSRARRARWSGGNALRECQVRGITPLPAVACASR